MKHITNPLRGVPNCENPLFDQIYAGQEGHIHYPIAKSLHHHGFAVIDFADDALSQRIDRIIDGLGPQFDLKAYARQEGTQNLRVQDAWREDDDIKAIAINQTVLDILSFCYGRGACAMQTLNFPVGTQQHYHSDCVHFSSMPERFMAGVWLAMEDVDEDNGPLVYYPGSHKFPVLSNVDIGFDWTGNFQGQQPFHAAWDALIDVHDLQPEIFTPRKGQALIWCANLLHGGMPVLDKSRTRWSQVTHYYFDDCAYYQPMKTDFVLGRAMWLDRVDIATGKPLGQKSMGQDIDPNFRKMLRENTTASNRGEPMTFNLPGKKKHKRTGWRWWGR